MTSSACTQPAARRAGKVPHRPNNTKAPRRGSRAQPHSRAMLLSGMLLWVAVTVMILMPCVRLATAAAHSALHLRGADARVVAAMSTSQAAGAGVRGLQSLEDDEAPETAYTPESGYTGKVVYGLPYVADEDVMEGCPAEFQDVVFGPGRRLLMYCYQCPCRCQFCCGVESSVFHGTCRAGNGSNILCGPGF